MICVSPETVINDALKVMNEKKIGAILIQEGENIIGIWTERDLMKNIIIEDFDIKTAKIKDYMATNIQYALYTETIFQLKDKFLGKRLRHLLIEKDKKYIGLLSAGDVMKASLNEKTKELESLNAIANWEYYENWKWKKKKH
jgi:signal-transduction protein with cAMP-binding, CBS, and nucleotidyltransferase domain